MTHTITATNHDNLVRLIEEESSYWFTQSDDNANIYEAQFPNDDVVVYCHDCDLSTTTEYKDTYHVKDLDCECATTKSPDDEVDADIDWSLTHNRTHNDYEDLRNDINQLIPALYGDDILALYWQGSGMGWTNRSGWKRVDDDDDPLEDLSIDSDYTLDVTVDIAARSIHVSRGSHDEPTGAGFTLHALKPLEYHDLVDMPEWMIRQLCGMCDIHNLSYHGSPEDRAEALTFLASDFNDWVEKDSIDPVWALRHDDSVSKDTMLAVLEKCMREDGFDEVHGLLPQKTQEYKQLQGVETLTADIIGHMPKYEHDMLVMFCKEFDPEFQTMWFNNTRVAESFNGIVERNGHDDTWTRLKGYIEDGIIHQKV